MRALIGIAGNLRKDCARKTAKKAIDFLKKKKIPFVVDSGFLKAKAAVQLNKISARFLLVFGGDGTMLYAVRERKRQIPLLGINCGSRGHLMEVPPEKTTGAIEKILQKEFSLEKRARLEITIDGKRAPNALNEMIITPKKSFTLFDYSLAAGKFVSECCSDAIAIVTPTGSTAFALAAGGKKLGATKRLFEILPVHPFSGLKKPLLVKDSEKISIALLSSGIPCEAIIDGQKRIPVKKKVVVEKSKEPALFIKLNQI